ncbi:MAG: GGDEF domain-containing protein [Gammaproteobacteria bacterium]|jgi:diguanylate cyclase (GGDEF)-like protein
MSSAPHTDVKILPVKRTGSLNAILESGRKTVPDTLERVLQIAGLLQSSLKVEDIISRFSNELNAVVPHNHLQYINEKFDVNFAVGKRSRFSCTYELTINESKLGILTLSRGQEFSGQDIEQLEQLISALHYPLRNALMYQDAVLAAHKDPLTGIGNRAAMTTTLYRQLELAFRHERSLGLIMMDIDHFKKINDQYGHAVGDFALQSLVECAEKTVRISDMMFRYGGEEFVIVLPETDDAGVLRLAKRIRRRVEKLETRIHGYVIPMTVSIGIATLQETDDEKSFIARADQALYRAKREGRNCIRKASKATATT